MTNAISYPVFKAWDHNGAHLVGGKLYSYEVGTDTPTTTYSDVDLTIPNTNPVILDSVGEARVYFDGSVKMVLKSSDDVLIWSVAEVQASTLWTFSPATAAVFYSSVLYGGTQAAIEAALVEVGSTEATIYLAPDDWLITDDLITPANVTLKPERGALLIISSTKTLTINGPLDAGPYQIFSCTGTGKVVFGRTAVSTAYPEWWGAIGDADTANAAVNYAAIQAAIDAFPNGGGNVMINGFYHASATIVAKSGVNLKGTAKIPSSYYSSYIAAYGSFTPTVLILTKNNIVISDFGISGDGVSGNALEIKDSSYINPQRIYARADGGIALRLTGGIHCNFDLISVSNSAIGILIEYSDTGSGIRSSINKFIGGAATSCTTAAVKVTDGYDNLFYGFETYSSPIGWLLAADPANDNRLRNLFLTDCHTENNDQALDFSSTGPDTVPFERVTIRGGMWSTKVTTGKMFKIGQYCRMDVYDPMIYISNNAQELINAAAGSEWHIHDWANANAENLTLTNNSTRWSITNATKNFSVFTANSATPSVLRNSNTAVPVMSCGAVNFKTNNTNPTTITNFTEGYPGQAIKVVINDAVTTVDFTGSNLKGNAALGDWSPSSGDWMDCVYDGTNWYCSINKSS